ncbi:hypothetical protein EDB84DRAFT_1441037 [Lactarius hengduanensis]|nr:hypothetical protein EDB84DRAFT_1441037 [Lactarius hengduanensis]
MNAAVANSCCCRCCCQWTGYRGRKIGGGAPGVGLLGHVSERVVAPYYAIFKLSGSGMVYEGYLDSVPSLKLSESSASVAWASGNVGCWRVVSGVGRDQETSCCAYCAVFKLSYLHGSNETVRGWCTPNGGLKEAHEMDWPDDPDDITRYPIARAPHLSDLVAPYPNHFESVWHHYNGATGLDNRRPNRIRKPTEKVKEALARGSAQKNKNKKDAEDVSLIEEPRKTSKSHLFSRASEESQDSRVNKTSNSDDLGNASMGEDDVSDAKGGASDAKGDASDASEEWQYSQLEKMATNDAKSLKKANLRSSTGGNIKLADLIGIFKDGKHPKSNRDARWCRLCKIWLSGNVSTCRTHIIRQWNTHGESYLTGCQREDVEPNERVMSAVREVTPGTKSQEQGTLEGWSAVKVPQWTKDGLREHIVELVVVNDQAFSLVDCPVFRRLLTFQRPGTKDSDIPHRTSIAKAVHEKALKVKDILNDLFASTPGEVSVTLDGWSSLARDPYLELPYTGSIAPANLLLNGVFVHCCSRFERLKVTTLVKPCEGGNGDLHGGRVDVQMVVDFVVGW